MSKLLFILAVLTLAPVANAETTSIEWSDLVDQSAQEFEDPFATMEYANTDRLVQINRLRNGVAGLEETDPERAEAEAKIALLTSELSEQGLDADWLFSQRWIVAERRELAATSGNPDVDGKEIVIAGYAIPAPSTEGGPPVLYLVPERGMCSHMPPPASNQMIRARMPDDWEASMMHQPVRLTGQLSIMPTEQTFQIIDGPVQMRATFEMEVSEVEDLVQMQSDQLQTNDWVEDLAKRLRAADQAPSQSKQATE